MKIKVVTTSESAAFASMPNGNFFSGENWCSCYDARLKRFLILDEKENSVGRFAAFEGGKAGMKTLITPPFAPHIGLSVTENKSNPAKVNTFRKQIIDTIADFLLSSGYVYYKLDFAPEWTDMQPMLWKKIHTQVRYTYRIDLSRTVTNISEGLDANKRNKINKASREGFSISNTPDIPLGLKMITENLRDKPVKLHHEILKNILALSAEDSHGIWTFSMKDGKTEALNICIKTSDTCYNLLSAIDRKSGHNHAGTFCLYSSIIKAKNDSLKIFDFEGSGVPEIEEYFRSFGGDITPYFTVTGGKWPWPIILKWKQKKGPF